jgi:DNA-binding response OmpR family regulator
MRRGALVNAAYESAEPLFATLPLTGGELMVMRELDFAQGVPTTNADIAAATGLQGGSNIEVLIGRIRKKLAAAEVPLRINTLRSRGYYLERTGGDS